MDVKVSDRFDDDEVADIVRGHDQWVQDRSPFWARCGRAYRSEFWTGPNPWSLLPGIGTANDPFPVKVEVNQVWPFVQAHVANLFYRAPRCEIEFPAVTEVTGGRPKDDTTSARRVKAFDDEWIRRSDTQELSTYALQLSLFHTVSAYKLGMKANARGVMDRVWVDVIPAWELVWDDRARSYEQQAYRGHIRWERIDRAREIVGNELPDAELSVLPDVLEDEGGRPSTTEKHRAKKYVRLLEFYDLLEGKQRFYLVTGHGPGACVKQVGESAPIPWELANGRAGVPILPVILSNEPEFPLKGISAVARIYGLAAETNLMMTIVANMLRRDSARLSVMHPDAPEELVKAIREAVDGTVVKLNKPMSLDKVISPIEWGRASETLDKYRSMLMEGRQDAQGMSDLMQGRQGKYLSATEADILAGTGETTAIEIGQRMSEAMARTIELVNVMIASTMKEGGSFHVQTIQGREKLSQEELLLPWTIGIVDSGTTPVREGKRKAEFLSIQAPLIELAKLASAPDAPVGAAPAGMPGAPAAPVAPPIPGQVRTLAQLQLDYMVQLFGLPESMSWRALVNANGAEEKPAELDPAQLAKVQGLMDRVIPDGPAPLPGV